MTTRIPGSERTRETLNELINGRMRVDDAKSELVKLATRLILEEGLEAEVRDALGRDYYEHGADPNRGYRNGVRGGKLKTAEGVIEYSAPQVAGTDEPGEVLKLLGICRRCILRGDSSSTGFSL